MALSLKQSGYDKSGKSTWTLVHKQKDGTVARDVRFSPVLTLWEAEILLFMEKAEANRHKVKGFMARRVRGEGAQA